MWHQRTWVISVVLRVWPQDQCQHHHLRPCQKHKFLDPTQTYQIRNSGGGTQDSVIDKSFLPMILMHTHGPESPCYTILWAMAGEAKGDQINEPRGTGVQEGKTQEVGSTKSESSELGHSSWSLSGKEG